MRSEYAHISLGRNVPAGAGGAAAARAAYASLHRELRRWYRRLARKLRNEGARGSSQTTRRP
ncbi:MAG TPA: hypothetical protein VMW93_10910 [bacterium]|nr:hypothetical protein [bacterium]